MYDAVRSSAPSTITVSIPPPSSDVGSWNHFGGGWPYGSVWRCPKTAVSCVTAANESPSGSVWKKWCR